VVGRLLDEYHERSIPPADFRLVSGSVHETRVTYQVALPGGSAHLIRAFRADELIPVHGRGLTSMTMADWLVGKARMLGYLDAVGYPAPRPVRSRTGELIGVAGPWLSWATTYIPGETLSPTYEQLRLLGAALGTLHSLPIGTDGTRVSLGSRHPAIAIPPTLSRLDGVAHLVPPELGDMHAAFRRCAEAVRDRAASVPEAIVHGDVWARNAVQDKSGAVTLIDWEAGGVGLAVQDLGNFLLECHLDSGLPDDQPSMWLVMPDERRIAAAAEGYASVRTLSDAELDLLPTAVMFTAAVVGAIHLEAALTSGVAGSSMDARLARLRNRIAVAAEVAALARPHLVGS